MYLGTFCKRRLTRRVSFLCTISDLDALMRALRAQLQREAAPATWSAVGSCDPIILRTHLTFLFTERRVRLSECVREIGGNQSIEVTLNRETKLPTRVEAPNFTVAPLTAADNVATSATSPQSSNSAPGHNPGEFNVFM